MDGAADRIRREKALVWWGAMMPHLKTQPTFEEFTGQKAVPKEPDWRGELARWEAYAAVRH